MKTSEIPKIHIPQGEFHAPKDPVETRKDKLDLQPAVAFIHRHLALYEDGFERLMKNKKNPGEEASGVICLNTEFISHPQITPEQISNLLTHLPRSVLKLSMLETVNYADGDMIPVP